MEYLILFGALLAVGVLVFAKGIWDDRQTARWQMQKIKEAFGKPSEREYGTGELDSIPRYFEQHQEGFFIDDITWNDLNLDELFLRMNDTHSSAGQEYLYYMLRTPVFDRTELKKREEVIRFMLQEENLRLRLQMLYLQMGRTGKYSIYDYLGFLDNLGERSSTGRILADLLFVPAIALIPVSPQLGIAALLVLLSVNVSTYMKEKRAIEPYLISFKYVFRTLTLSKKLGKEPIPVLKEEQKRLLELAKRFQKLEKSAAFGMRSMGSGGSPLDILMDYLNMIFHFDVLCFNRMLHLVREREADIDEMLSITGRIEALIAAAGFRKSLPGWCVPVFSENSPCGSPTDVPDGQTDDADIRITAKQLYHPMLAEPVRNDLQTGRGILLTGSNASGKSTFLKTVAVNAILAQTVHTCSADSWQGSLYRVMTSMALRDDMGSGESYYIVEIKSLKRILDAAAQKGAAVLCFVDEVLRGTNTVERIAASTQILKSLHRPGVVCFAATHDIELTELLEQEYDNYHFEEVIAENDIFFPYQLMQGKAVTRNAIRLLSIMGYEEGIIADAEALAAQFVRTGSWKKKAFPAADAQNA